VTCPCSHEEEKERSGAEKRSGEGNHVRVSSSFEPKVRSRWWIMYNCIPFSLFNCGSGVSQDDRYASQRRSNGTINRPHTQLPSPSAGLSPSAPDLLEPARPTRHLTGSLFWKKVVVGRGENVWRKVGTSRWVGRAANECLSTDIVAQDEGKLVNRLHNQPASAQFHTCVTRASCPHLQSRTPPTKPTAQTVRRHGPR
jgi:hypothetical protein